MGIPRRSRSGPGRATARPSLRAQLEIAVKKYRTTAPKLAEWLEANVPEGLAVFALPPCTGGGCGRSTCWSGSTRR